MSTRSKDHGTTRIKPFFVSGLHNVGYTIAIAIWIAAIITICNQFFFEADFEVISIRKECEQPLNNRCSFVYFIKEANGDQHWRNLIEFRGSQEDLKVNNAIKKKRFRFDYQVNGIDISWNDGPKLILAIIFAFVPFSIARLKTPIKT